MSRTLALSELHTAQDVPTELLQIAHMKGSCGFSNHKDVWVLLAAQIYRPKTSRESSSLSLSLFMLLPKEENFPYSLCHMQSHCHFSC